MGRLLARVVLGQARWDALFVLKGNQPQREWLVPWNEEERVSVTQHMVLVGFVRNDQGDARSDAAKAEAGEVLLAISTPDDGGPGRSLGIKIVD